MIKCLQWWETLRGAAHHAVHHPHHVVTKPFHAIKHYVKHHAPAATVKRVAHITCYLVGGAAGLGGLGYGGYQSLPTAPPIGGAAQAGLGSGGGFPFPFGGVGSLPFNENDVLNQPSSQPSLPSEILNTALTPNSEFLTIGSETMTISNRDTTAEVPEASSFALLLGALTAFWLVSITRRRNRWTHSSTTEERKSNQAF